jgi:hypothetical protein
MDKSMTRTPLRDGKAVGREGVVPEGMPICLFIRVCNRARIPIDQAVVAVDLATPCTSKVSTD